MIKAKVSRDNLDYEAHGSAAIILTDLAALVDAIVGDACEKTKLDRDGTLDTLFRVIKEAHKIERKKS